MPCFSPQGFYLFRDLFFLRDTSSEGFALLFFTKKNCFAFLCKAVLSLLLFYSSQPQLQ